ncbi:MAG: GFA family protein [Hyphomicrobiales bacterium]|nr:GFA family protein [Hyphomicrobiales bacterium]
MTAMKGGCLCGQIRYTLKSAPAATVLCHCTHCQKASGSAFSVNLVAPLSEIEMTGTLASYDDTGDSGNLLKRSFCGTCGSSIMSEPAARPGVAILKAGSLDDPSSVKPGLQIWTRSAQPWVKFAADMPSMEQGR